MSMILDYWLPMMNSFVMFFGRECSKDQTIVGKEGLNLFLFGCAKTKTPIALFEYPEGQYAYGCPAKLNAAGDTVIIENPPVGVILRATVLPWFPTKTLWWTEKQIVVTHENMTLHARIRYAIAEVYGVGKSFTYKLAEGEAQ